MDSKSEWAQLSLFRATEEQVLESRKRTFVQWGRGSTIDHYIRRDEILNEFEHAKEGKLIIWVLAPRADSKTLNFKCSCETYRRRGLELRKDSINHDNTDGVREVTCYGIASVFTPEINRGKGYARYMMRLLQWVLSPESFDVEFPTEWGAAPTPVPPIFSGSFSVLYSDIGEEFYRRCGYIPGKEGWIVKEHLSTSWTVSAHSPRDNDANSWTCQWLDESAAAETWREDAKLMKRDLIIEASNKESKGDGVFITFLPDNGVAAFLHRRASFFLEGRDVRLPQHHGIRITPAPGQGGLTFATWSLDPGSKPSSLNLIITRMRSTPEMFPFVLERAMEVARQLQVEQVEIWNLPANLQGVAHELGGKTRELEEHLPALKSFSSDSSSVRWLFNEKFCWC